MVDTPIDGDDEIKALQARVTALELALHHLVFVLKVESGFPDQAYPQWLYSVLDSEGSHQTLAPEELDALRRFADRDSGIREELPEYLKQLRRDFPPGQPDKHTGD